MSCGPGARALLLAAMVGAPLAAEAACPDDQAVAAYLADFKAARESKAFAADLSLSDAECARGKVVKALPPVLGKRVGYKAAFTNPAVQQRFGVQGPAWGAMFEKLMLASGAKVPAKFGARPQYEADLVAVVKSPKLASAKTPLEALQHLREVAPFIELPDLMLEGAFKGNQLIAANVAFRGGVLGKRLAVEPTQAFADALAAMTIVVTEQKSGKELGRAPGKALMEHPLSAAIWLAQALEKSGVALAPGDLLSLGGFLPPAPAQAGTAISVKYLGLPGDPSVSVEFQ